MTSMTSMATHRSALSWLGALLTVVYVSLAPNATAQTQSDVASAPEGQTVSSQAAAQPYVPQRTLWRSMGFGMATDQRGIETDRDLRMRRVQFGGAAWYNRVEALHLGLNMTVRSSPYFTLHGGGGSSIGLSKADRWTGHISGTLTSLGDTRVFASSGYQTRTARRYGATSYVTPLANSVAMLTGGDDYFDYYRSEGFYASAGIDLKEIRTRLTGTYHDERHASLPLTTSYDLFGAAALRDNTAINAGHMQTVSVQLAVGDPVSTDTPIALRSLVLGAESTLPDTEFSFRRYWADARWRQKTLRWSGHQRAMLDLRLVAGTSTGHLPLQRAFIVESGLSVFTTFGALRSVSGRPFEGEQVVAFFWEHNFRSMLTDILGFKWLFGSTDWIIFGGHARTWAPAQGLGPYATTFVSRITNGAYHELGVSLGGIMHDVSNVRLDFAKPLHGGPVRIGLGLSKSF